VFRERMAGFKLGKIESFAGRCHDRAWRCSISERDGYTGQNGVCFAALLSFRRKDRDGSASLAVTPRQSSGQARRTAAHGHRQTGPLGLNCV
jgi:hypothetical protein